MFIWQIFSKLLLAMNYFDSAIGNGIFSVHYQIGGDL